MKMVTKKLVSAGLTIFALALRCHGQLAITEVMSGENDKNHPDWYELHNYGTNAIDLTGYSWNDDAHGGFSGADTAPFSGVVVAPGETIAVTEQKGVVTDAASFRSWWGASNDLQVVVLNSADPGLSANPLVTGTKRADSVRLWRTNLAALAGNTNGLDLDECSDFMVQRADLGNTTIQALHFDPLTGVFDILATNTDGISYVSPNGEVGSPGTAPASIPATMAQLPMDQVATIGDSVSFTNGGVALPALSFHWYFNDTLLTSQTPGFSVHHYTPGISNPLTNEISVLTIASVQTTNQGSYKVIASNGLQSFTNTFQLTVNSGATAPTVLSFTPNLAGPFDGYVGQTVNFGVTASGFPAPTYQWYKGNQLISGQTGAQYPLSLTDSSQSDVYTVVVTNSAGGTNVSFNLNVTPVPDLVITEVQSDEGTNTSNGDPTGHNDWFELSNFGNFPVNLYGYRIDDSHNALGSSALIATQAVIHPSESVVFVQDMTPAAFRTWWGTNLPASVQIITYNGAGQGLSGSGDEVHVWNAVATANSDQAAQAQFFTGTVGDTFGFDLSFLDQSGFDGITLSTNGVDGAFVAAVGGDIGSPGTVINVPRLTGVAATGSGVSLSWFSQPNWNYTIQYKTNIADATWTTLTKVMSGNTNSASYTDPSLDPQRFYRVYLNLQNQ